MNWCVQVTYCGSYHRNTQYTAGNNGGGCTRVTGVFCREQYRIIEEREDESDIRAVGLKYGLRNDLIRDQGSYGCGRRGYSLITNGLTEVCRRLVGGQLENRLYEVATNSGRYPSSSEVSCISHLYEGSHDPTGAERYIQILKEYSIDTWVRTYECSTNVCTYLPVYIYIYTRIISVIQCILTVQMIWRNIILYIHTYYAYKIGLYICNYAT